MIMDYSYWDLIDHLWAYLLDLLADIVLHEKKESECYFPDQPIKIVIKAVDRHNISLLVGSSRWFWPRSEFFDVLLAAAQVFFEKLVNITGDIRYQSKIVQIEKIKKREALRNVRAGFQ